MRRTPTPDEALKRRFRADLLEAIRPQLRSSETPAWLTGEQLRRVPETPAWLKGPAALKHPCRVVDGHAVAWCAWNGDRWRGWAFYCVCGFCTPMRRSFSEGLELIEAHWTQVPGKDVA
jgi:hypothetical protein